VRVQFQRGIACATLLAALFAACADEAPPEVAAPRGKPIAGPSAPVERPREAPRLSPTERLARDGFEALRMTDAERAEIAAALEASERRVLPSECFPERVRELDGATAVLRGWMIPGRMEKRNVREFMLVRDNAACCFGATPTFDEWIHVEMEPGAKAEYLRQVCVEVTGVLTVGGKEQVEGIDPPALRMRASRCRFVESPKRP
jgi:hypothetical protein